MCSKKLFKIFKILNPVILLCLTGCKSNKVEDKNIPPIPYILEENVEFPDDHEPHKYIFFRLYNPNYANPFYIANFLQKGINITETNNFELSHASINFSLDDNFYGLTINGPKQFERESCSNITSNNYMSRCNPITSEQITFALQVTPEEYESTKKMVEEYYKAGDIRYNTSDNFLIGLFLIKRKFLTPKKRRSLEKLNYPHSVLNEHKQKDPNYIENDFVCSTFIAYILSHNIPEIHTWFTENKVNYNYINVTDLPYLPGIKPLFYSTWENYETACNLFVQQNLEFIDYLKKE